MVRIRQLATGDRGNYQEGVIGLEGGVSYPLGDDFFKISHGTDYYRFFDRLGDVHYVVATKASGKDSEVIGAQCFILRKVPLRSGQSELTSVWYSCDTKVHGDHRGDGLGSKLLSVFVKPGMLWSQTKAGAFFRAYGVSMNTSSGDNQMRSHAAYWQEKLPGMSVRSETLHLYSLDFETMEKATVVVGKHRGRIGYLSLGGVKDIVLQSTGKPMPLLHVQWGALADPTACKEPRKNHVHMFCAVKGSPLAQDIELGLGIQPDATATVYSMRMHTDFSFILTSDI